MNWQLKSLFITILFSCLQIIGAQEQSKSSDTEDLEEADLLDDMEDPFNTDSDKETVSEIPDNQESTAQEGSEYKEPIIQFRGNTSAQFSFIPQSDSNSRDTGRGTATLNLVMQAKPWSLLRLFCDITGKYKLSADSENALNTGFEIVCNQVGLSLRPVDQLNITLGKERRIFAPGLFVYPSEFIMIEGNLPGLENQLLGIWLLRCSYETPWLTIDTMLLPFTRVDEYGLPDLEAFNPDEIGVAGRLLWVLNGIDIGITIGYLDTTLKAGCSFSTYIVSRLELHGELGYTLEDEHLLDIALNYLLESGASALLIASLQSLQSDFQQREHVLSALLGLRWQIIDEIMISLEGYYNGNGLTAHEFEVFSAFPSIDVVSQGFFNVPNSSNIFIRRVFVIGQANFQEIYDLFNIQLTAIIGLEDGACLGLVRSEWLASSHSTLSITIMGFYNPPEGQYFMRPYDWQLTGAWKISF